MIELARALEKLATERGARFRYGSGVSRILTDGGRTSGVVLEDGERLDADCVVYNGDPAGLSRGLLGEGTRRAVRGHGTRPRSLSAWVWAFAATPSGHDLHHHNVFFGRHQADEFSALDRGEIPSDPTLYVCAQDRGSGTATPATERFEIIMNGAPVAGTAREKPEEFEQCRTRTFQTLQGMGLTFDPEPERVSLITPGDFATRFPASEGSLYGRSPHGTMATFRRPTTRSRIPGLYLAGGGVHPGAGLPMASLSGQHAAAAILKDRALISRSRQTAMPGGTSTASRMMGHVQSRSSGS
jgi:1-hydroxycarotenoid 3,4-desaturase